MLRRAIVLSAVSLACGACLLRQDLGEDDVPAAPESEDADAPSSPSDAAPGPDSPAADGGKAKDGGTEGDPSKKDAEAGLSGDDAFEESCVAGPILPGGLQTLVLAPAPYKVAARKRSCVGSSCGPWQKVSDNEPVDVGLGGLLRLAGKTGKLKATSQLTFVLESDETCAGSATAVYGAENCNYDANSQATCTYYYAPVSGSSCDQSVAIPYFAGVGSASCVQMTSSFDDGHGNQYEFGVIVRF